MPVGGVAEWSNAPVLKTDGRESVPRVRIPEPPPTLSHSISYKFLNLYAILHENLAIDR